MKLKLKWKMIDDLYSAIVKLKSSIDELIRVSGFWRPFILNRNLMRLYKTLVG